nr:RNA-dependent RNA polymerase [Mute swan feces associated partitiviridae L]
MQELPSSQGFSVDFSVPRYDEVAYEMANKWFGKTYVANTMEKFHRSVPTLQAMVDDFMGFDRIRPHRLSDAVYTAVLDSVRRDFVPEVPLVPLTLGGVKDHPDFPKSKSPGLPYILEGVHRKDIAFDRDFGNLLGVWDRIGRGRPVHLPDVCAYFRAQLATHDKDKIRAVWGFPLAVTAEEARFVYPYLEWIKKSKAPVSYGLEMAKGGMAYINSMLLSGRTYCCLDWSSFDKCPPAWLIRDVFGILKQSFDMSSVLASDGKYFPVRKDKSDRRWERLVSYFINTTIRFPDGRRFRKDGGIPSGSVFTNIVDTIVNCIVTRYMVYQCTGHLPEGEIYHGDDSVLSLRGCVNLDDWSKLALSSFGLVLSTKKSWCTKNRRNVHFLGFYNSNGFPIRSQDFILSSFIEPERVITSVLETTARAVGQMYSTLHPMQAAKWWCIVNDLMHVHSLSKESLSAWISEHPERFKYLWHFGFKPGDIVIPETSVFGGVREVTPPAFALKTWTMSPSTFPTQAFVPSRVEASAR